MENMHFSINSRVLEHLGKDLITSDEIAITELVKNSYDAKADKVRIHFFDNYISDSEIEFLNSIPQEIKEILGGHSGKMIIMEDNGDGMSISELKDGFFTIGTDIKKKQKQDEKLQIERLPLGEKGIGRLAAQRLSKTLFIETADEASNYAHLVKIEWEKFFADAMQLQDISMEYSQIQKTGLKYTRLWFIDSQVDFEKLIIDKRNFQLSVFDEDNNEDKLYLADELLSLLSFLISPFEKSEKKMSIKEEFEINFFYNNDLVNAKFNNEIIKVAETLHTFSFEKIIDEENKENYILKLEMSLRPWYVERIHYGLVGRELFNDKKLTADKYKEILEEYHERYEKSLKATLDIDSIKQRFQMNDTEYSVLKELANIEGEVYSFKRSSQLAPLAVKAAKELDFINKNLSYRKITKFLENHNGIKLYRGSYRVTTLGDKDSDWLRLQQSRTKGQQFFRFELGNVLGYVKVNDAYQKYIKETSSRLNLSDNLHSKILLNFLHAIFNEIFYTFSQSAYYITKDILNEKGLLPKRSLENLKNKVDETNKKIAQTEKELEDLSNIFKKFQIELHDTQDSRVKNLLSHLNSTTAYFKETLRTTSLQMKDTHKLVVEAEAEKKLIKLESYNNYKLMANGLITEVLTHELHSIISNVEQVKDLDAHFKAIEDYLLNNDEYELIEEHYDPLKEGLSFVNIRIKELGSFYSLMEKTFLYNGTADDFEEEEMQAFMRSLKQRLDFRLIKENVELDYSSLDMKWSVPKGVLIHVFYNLIDNSLYWINEKRKREDHNKEFIKANPECISIIKNQEDVIYYKDSGTGVFQSMESTLFEPLSSGKEKGRGMGLYIIRKLLRSFGGDIELMNDKNTYGNRYIFAIYLNANLEEQGVES